MFTAFNFLKLIFLPLFKVLFQKDCSSTVGTYLVSFHLHGLKTHSHVDIFSCIVHFICYMMVGCFLIKIVLYNLKCLSAFVMSNKKFNYSFSLMI